MQVETGKNGSWHQGQTRPRRGLEGHQGQLRLPGVEPAARLYSLSLIDGWFGGELDETRVGCLQTQASWCHYVPDTRLPGKIIGYSMAG